MLSKFFDVPLAHELSKDATGLVLKNKLDQLYAHLTEVDAALRSAADSEAHRKLELRKQAVNSSIAVINRVWSEIHNR